MQLRALETFTYFPEGDDTSGVEVKVGSEFDVADEGLAELLVAKGHAEEAEA